MVTVFRNFIAWIYRMIPYFPGLGRSWCFFNRVTLKLGASPNVTVKMKNNTVMNLDLRSGSELHAFYRGTYDESTFETIGAIVDVEAVFLDVGANVGFYTVFIANHIRSRSGRGRVIAFEPFYNNYAKAVQNIESNRLSNYAEVKNIGLSDQNQQAHLVLREDFKAGSQTGNASIAINSNFDSGCKTVSVEMKRLDDIFLAALSKSQKIDFIKLDIEGHEDFFLRGAVNVLNNFRPTIFMEINKPYYGARRVDPEKEVLRAVPDEYGLFRFNGRRWVRFKSFEECKKVENIFLIPEERLLGAQYQIIFNNTK